MLRLKDRWRDSSTCAFLLWLGARCGMAGTGAGAVVADVTGLLEKKSLVSLPIPISEKGVNGVMGLREEEEELSAVKNPLSMLEKSLSLWIEPDEVELVSERPETLRMSGALRAWTLVVESNSVGSEILARLMVPGAYLTVQERGRVFSSPRVCARARLVKLRTRDMVLVASGCGRRRDGRWISIFVKMCAYDGAFARWFRALFRLAYQRFVALDC